MLYLLDKDVKTVKWNGIPLHEASSAIVKEEVNGDFVLTVRYPITDSSIYQLIKEDMLIKAPAPVLGAQLFRIKKPVENDDSLDITAYHITDDVMQRSINPVNVVGQSCAMALSQMVQNAKTDLGNFSFTSDIMDSRTFNTTETGTLYSVLLDGKHSIVGTWEGELVRDNFALSIKRSRGADRGVVITTHKNLKSYQRTKNSQSVVTRIYARSTFRAEGAEEETTIRVTVDSPLIGNYPYINEKEYQNNDIYSVEELRKWAERKFKYENIDKPSDEIKIEAYELDGQVIHLGDTVNIKSRKHDVDLYKKAIAYEYNALTEEYISITFDDKAGVGGSGVSSGVSNAADVILEVNANAQEIAVERAIRNANQAFDTEFDKRVEEINDGIEQAKAEAERYADNIKQTIDTEIAQVEQSMQSQAQEHDRQVADILSKTQSVEDLANAALSDAVYAVQRSNELKYEAMAEANRLVQAQGTALTERIQSVDVRVDDVANQVSSKVSQIDFDAVKKTVKSNSTAITQNQSAIELKADKTVTDALATAVNQTKSELKITSDAVATKVSKTDFDATNQRLATAETTIRTQAGLIEQRLTSTQVEQAITGKGYQTKAQVDSNITGRGYITNDALVPYTTTVTLENKVKETVEGFNRTISRVESKADSQSVALNSITETVGSHTQTISSMDGKITQNIQTTEGILARTASLIDHQNLVYDPTNYSKYRERNSNSNLTLVGTTNYKLVKIHQTGLTANGWKGFQMPLQTQRFVEGEKLSYRVNLWVDAVPDGKVGIEIKAGGVIVAYTRLAPTTTGANQIFTGTITVARSVTATDEFGLHVWLEKNGTVAVGQISIVRGDQPPQSFVDNTSSMQLATETRMSQLAGSWSVQNLTSAGTVLNQLNLNRDGSVRIDGKLVQITGTTYIQDGVISSAKIGSLDAGKITTGTLSAARIAANSIDGSKMVFDQAFVNKMTANEAYLQQIFAKNAFITQVQAVTLSASKISGGVLSSLNSTTNFNLQTGWIDMNAESVGIRNLWPDNPIQYLVFGRGSINGKSGTYTALMSNSRRTIGMNDGSAGIQIWNTMDNTTAINLYGDEIVMMYNANDSKGLIFNNVNNTIGNVDNIYLSGYGNHGLVALLNDIYTNLRLLHQNKSGGSYSYSMYGPK